MTYNTLADVPTPELERHLDILERLRDRGDFADHSDFEFYFGTSIPMIADETDAQVYDFEEEAMAVLEELMGRTDR